MRNLDACILGAYHGTPFQHPLERPFLTKSMIEGITGGIGAALAGAGAGGAAAPGAGTPAPGLKRRK